MIGSWIEKSKLWYIPYIGCIYWTVLQKNIKNNRIRYEHFTYSILFTKSEYKKEKKYYLRFKGNEIKEKQ